MRLGLNISGLKAVSVVLSPDMSQRPVMINSKPMMIRDCCRIQYATRELRFNSLFSISDIPYMSFLIVDKCLLSFRSFRIIDRHQPCRVNR